MNSFKFLNALSFLIGLSDLINCECKLHKILFKIELNKNYLKKKLKSFFKAFENIGCHKAGNNCWDDVFDEKMSSDQANKTISNFPLFTIRVHISIN
jgi:hypothetical protein